MTFGDEPWDRPKQVHQAAEPADTEGEATPGAVDDEA